MTKIRGSTLPRFMTCNASALVGESTDNEFSMEGTAAHEFLESKFKGESSLVGAFAKNGIQFDSDMEHFANRTLAHIPPTAVAEVEVSYPLSSLTVVGHVDYHWEEDGGDTLVVMDYKYGHRVVEVEKNWQLIGYAIGILFLKQRSYNKVIMRVIQPRAHHQDGWIRDAIMTSDQLQSCYSELLNAAINFERSHISYVTSDKCRYCPALATTCPAMNRAFFNSVDVTLDTDIKDDLTNEELAYMIRLYDRVKDIFKIKFDALSDLAKNKIKAGQVIDGYGIEVAYANRSWADDFNADNFKLLTGLDVTKKVMMSPADAEKAKIDQSLIDSFTNRKQKGFTLIKTNPNKQAEQVFGKGQ